MIQGSCHCGAVSMAIRGVWPESATACNCTVCRRYGVLSAYDFEGEIKVSGPTQAYVRGDGDRVSFLPRMWLRGILAIAGSEPGGRRRIAVNLRLTNRRQ